MTEKLIKMTEKILVAYPEYLTFFFQNKISFDKVDSKYISFTKYSDINEYICLLNPDIKNVNRIILEYFPNAEIQIENDLSIKDGKIYYVNVICSDIKDENINFIILKDTMRIEHIVACRKQDPSGKIIIRSGTYHLTRLISLAKELYKKRITLTDGSVLLFGNYSNWDNDCLIPLSMYHILLHGYSWYNKFGFKSESYEQDASKKQHVSEQDVQKYNESLRQMNIVDFITFSIKKYNVLSPEGSDYNSEYIKNFILKIQEKLSDIFDKNDTIAQFTYKLSQKYIPRMKEIGCNDVSKLISKIFYFSAFVIMYDNSLYLNL